MLPLVGARTRLRKKKLKSAKALVGKRKRKQPATIHMIRKARAKAKPSSLEKTVEGWLVEAGVVFKKQYAIGRCHCDFYFPKTNTVLEVQGCFWHGHACDERPLTKDQMKRRRRDGRRFRFFREKGFTIAQLWGCEINSGDDTAQQKVLSLCCLTS